MDLTVLIRNTWNFQNRLTEEDVPAVAFACQIRMEDANESDEDGCLSAYHCRLIAKQFPASAERSTCIYVAAEAVLENIQEAFEVIAKGGF